MDGKEWRSATCNDKGNFFFSCQVPSQLINIGDRNAFHLYDSVSFLTI